MMDNRFLADKVRLCFELFRNDCRGKECLGDIFLSVSVVMRNVDFSNDSIHWMTEQVGRQNISTEVI